MMWAVEDSGRERPNMDRSHARFLKAKTRCLGSPRRPPPCEGATSSRSRRARARRNRPKSIGERRLGGNLRQGLCFDSGRTGGFKHLSSFPIYWGWLSGMIGWRIFLRGVDPPTIEYFSDGVMTSGETSCFPAALRCSRIKLGVAWKAPGDT